MQVIKERIERAYFLQNCLDSWNLFSFRYWMCNLTKTLICLFLFFLDYSFFIFTFFTPLLEYNCFIVLCQFLLYNKVNQLYVHIYPYIPSLLSLPPTLPIPPLYVVTKHRADLPVLCSSFPLAIRFTFKNLNFLR